uniref:Putative secreted protein n=1 Tax=Ixodes ricinus TaxID=34613 RepID=A0A6B0V2K3_IXORI
MIAVLNWLGWLVAFVAVHHKARQSTDEARTFRRPLSRSERRTKEVAAGGACLGSRFGSAPKLQPVVEALLPLLLWDILSPGRTLGGREFEARHGRLHCLHLGLRHGFRQRPRLNGTQHVFCGPPLVGSLGEGLGEHGWQSGVPHGIGCVFVRIQLLWQELVARVFFVPGAQVNVFVVRRVVGVVSRRHRGVRRFVLGAFGLGDVRG